MIQKLAHVTVLVKDQEEALRFYTEKLGLEKRQDDRMGDFRWLTVAPPGQPDVAIVLQCPAAPFRSPEEEQRLLAQVGQGTIWVLETDDCKRDYELLTERGVKFRSAPERMPWGLSAVFEDLYGNPFNLLEPSEG